MKIPKKIIQIFIISFLASGMCINTANASTMESLIGSGRWETAIKISQNGWSNATNAILVNDSSIADALSATPFAKLKDAPILLTGSEKLDDRTSVELKRLGVKNVFLIGGVNTLGKNIEKQLSTDSITYNRISGNDRYETSLKLAEELSKAKEVSNIVVVSGEKGLADAVSVGAAAAQEGIPIILSNPSNGIKIAENFIKNQNIEKSYIIGGIYSIPTSIEKNIPNSKRISGNNRNETNAKVIQEFYKETELKNIYVTKDGMKKQNDLIDSLSVGVLAAKNSAPIALVGNNLDSIQKDVLNTKTFNKITQVGGLGNENAVKDIMDMQEETSYIVKNVDELNVAMKKADANDTIKFKPEKRVSDYINIESSKSITIDLEGEYSQEITINLPNGEVNNKGDITGNIVIKNIKDGTLTNEGRINGIDIYDNDGCRIENKSSGEIWLVTIFSSAKDVYIKNDGDITKITNDCSSVNIKNAGQINTVNGIKEPIISGNRPKVNNTEKEEENIATGLYPSISSCTPIENGNILLTVPQVPRNSNYKIYYRVVDNKPTAMKVDFKINLSEWNPVEDNTPFRINAKNGSYIETVEVYISSKRVTRWGRSDMTNDGFQISEIAKGLSAAVNVKDGDVKLTILGASSGSKVYYRIIENQPSAMNVGDKINTSDWNKAVEEELDLKGSKVNGNYIELVELDNLTNTVIKWGVTDKIIIS